MKKLKLVYNPASGDKKFKFSLDAVISVFQQGGYESSLFRCDGSASLEDSFDEAASLDCVVCAGGDGTANMTLSAMKKKRIDCPLGIIPCGTANDFAAYLKMPQEPEEAAKAIMEGTATPADAGMANGRLFLNVCGSGLFTNISTLVDKDAKDILGKFAYYLKGLEQLPNFSPFRVSIQTKEKTIEEDVFLFLILNGAGAGGFSNLCPHASIQDGKLDLVAVKSQPISQLAVSFLKLLKGEDYLGDPGVISLQEPWLRVRALGGQVCETDVDGEKGPDLPIEAFALPNSVSLILPPQFGG
ncbi:MAG: YegS/Rv2252/BmrU family lipid kinase [Clostridiales bacterium]|nr:YegS/Rv2252/BmrU family lipid kinase [Clostridiales bacterium]MDR2750390.1 YegS/Rv2252/BmrU family lipid kinase [Clostridiales bacterium]